MPSSYTALVLAGNRRSGGDALAAAGQVSHKCFIDINGRPMLCHVVQALLDSGRIKHVVVSIDADSMGEAEALLRGTNALDRITFFPSEATIGASVLAAAQNIPDALPMVITTGDNALHTAEMVRFFCDQLDQEDCDVSLGLTDAEILLDKYPDGQRAFHRFKDGQFSSCNLYALLTRKGLAAPRAFNSGGQFGKKPWRIIFSFGPLTFLVYKSRRATLEGFLGLVSRALGVTARPVYMPFADGPIDVDSPKDWTLAQSVIAARSRKTGALPGSV